MKKLTVVFTLLLFVLGMSLPLCYATSTSDVSKGNVLLAKSERHELKEDIERLEKKIDELKEKESNIRKERRDAEKELHELKEKLRRHHS